MLLHWEIEIKQANTNTVYKKSEMLLRRAPFKEDCPKEITSKGRPKEGRGVVKGNNKRQEGKN